MKPREWATGRGKRVGSACKSGYKRGRKGIVIFITSDKVIQSVLTGSVTAIVFSLNEGIAAYIQRGLSRIVPFYLPVKIVAALGAVVVFIGAYWADRHTEEWRDYVREATGEETAEDTASDQDVTGEDKE